MFTLEKEMTTIVRKWMSDQGFGIIKVFITMPQKNFGQIGIVNQNSLNSLNKIHC